MCDRTAHLISHPPSFILLPCWVQTAQNTSRYTQSVITNFKIIMQYFAKQILWFHLPDLHQRKWIRCLLILIYIFSDLRFLESTFFLSLCVCCRLIPSLPLCPDKASWAFCCIILTLAVFLKGGEKKKKVLSPDRKLILVICIKNIKRHRHEKRIWGDTLIKHSG